MPTIARFTIDGPYQAGPMYRFLAKHAVYGVEVADETPAGWRYSRTLNLPGGQAVVTIEWDGAAFVATAHAQHTPDEALAIDGARRLLDLTADTASIDTVLATGPIAPLVAKTPGLRVPGAFDVS
ncbi:MAG: AlkA N-terminal domain-containing protein, partial [Antricoccus sp.]